MARLAHFLLAFTSLLSVSALDIHGRVQWNEICRNLTHLGPARVVLDDGRAYGGIRKDGSFVIPNVSNGTYLLSVIAHDHIFDQLRIDVDPSLATPLVTPYVAGTPLSPASTITLPYPIVLVARREYDYFVPAEVFSILKLFQSPMYTMMAVAAILMASMPYLIANLDEDTLNEVKGRQNKIAGIQSSIAKGDFKSGLSAIMDEPAGSPAKTLPTGGATPRKTGKPKRK